MSRWNSPRVGMSRGLGMQTLTGQGGAGKAGCAGNGLGALLMAWPCPRPRTVCRPEARDTCLQGRGPHLPCPAP